MKNILLILFSFGLLACNSCNHLTSEEANTEIKQDQRKPLKSIAAVKEFVKNKFKDSEETLWISNSLNDNFGVNMAIILDEIIKAGYQPNGFNQKEGYRIYKYKK